MALLGVNDLKQFVLPLGWDASELLKYQLADGTTYEEVVNDIATALVMANESFMNDPRYGGMFSLTQDLGREYRDGVSAGMQERSEYTRADVKRAATIGHMYPIKGYDRTLGWTYDFLRKARMAQIDADISQALYDVVNNFEVKLLTRAFTTTETLLGTSGYDVPFIAGSGGNIDHQPPDYDGKAFATSHTHFDRKTDDATGWKGALNAGALHLKEHGLMPPYTAIWNETDWTMVKAGVTGFVTRDYGINYVRNDSGVLYGTLENLADTFVAAFDSDYGLIYIWTTAHLPADYMGMFKSYGMDHPSNPLAVRYEADHGPGAILLRGEGFREFPLEHAVILHDFGVGVKERLNFYACEFDSSGSYGDPTIS